MIKVFLQLLAIHGVLCAPGLPFLEYGPPSETNLSEKRLPLEKLGSVKLEISGNLPGTRNLVAPSQIPSHLPGTRNLAEKFLPQSITQEKKTPIPIEDYEVPRYLYDGGFLQFDRRIAVPEEVQSEGYSYSHPTPLEGNGSELNEAGLFPNSNKPKPTPGESKGENILASTVSGPVKNTGITDSVYVAPGSSIKVQDNHGQYSYGYANPDGTEIEQSGHLISTDNGWEYVIAQEGSYQYLSPEGIPIYARYIADANGFRILSQSFGGW